MCVVYEREREKEGASAQIFGIHYDGYGLGCYSSILFSAGLDTRAVWRSDKTQNGTAADVVGH